MGYYSVFQSLHVSELDTCYSMNESWKELSKLIKLLTGFKPKTRVGKWVELERKVVGVKKGVWREGHG